MSLIEAVSANVKRLRERRGLSLAELGEESGYGKSNLSKLERHGKNTTLETIERLAAALRVEPGELLSTINSQPSTPQ